MLLMFLIIGLCAWWTQGIISILLWVLFYSAAVFVLASIIGHTIWHLTTLPSLDTYPGDSRTQFFRK